MKKRIEAFISQCANAELYLEVAELAKGDRTTILEELEGYTIISEDAHSIRAYRTDKFEVLKAELNELLKKGWVWGE